MKKLNILFGTLIAISILFFAACGGGGASGNSPSGVVDEYYDAFQSGDYEGMVMLFEGSESLSADKIKKNAEMFKMGESQLEARGGIKKFTVTEEEINDAGDAATLKIKTIYGNGDEADSEMNLVKVNGKWKFKKMF